MPEVFLEMKFSEAQNQKSLTQEQVSRGINDSLKHHQNTEHGLTSPTVNIALHICEVLNVDPRAGTYTGATYNRRS